MLAAPGKDAHAVSAKIQGLYEQGYVSTATCVIVAAGTTFVQTPVCVRVGNQVCTAAAPLIGLVNTQCTWHRELVVSDGAAEEEHEHPGEAHDLHAYTPHPWPVHSCGGGPAVVPDMRFLCLRQNKHGSRKGNGSSGGLKLCQQVSRGRGKDFYFGLAADGHRHTQTGMHA